MATAQISTSVSILSSGLKGFQGIALSGIGTASAPSFMAGSCWEQAGAFFLVSSDETPNASSWTAVTTAYSAFILATPAGSAGNQTISLSYTVDAPIWSDSKIGWYSSAGSNIRALAHVYKSGTTSYARKGLLQQASHAGYMSVGDSRAPASTIHIADIGGAGLHFDAGTPSIFNFLTSATTGRLDLFTEGWLTALSVMGSSGSVIFPYAMSATGGIATGGATLKTKIVNIGEWNMDGTATVAVTHGLTLDTVRWVEASIRNDSGTNLASIAYYDLISSAPSGYLSMGASDVNLSRVTGGVFDSASYDGTAGTVANRGFVTITYEA